MTMPMNSDDYHDDDYNNDDNGNTDVMNDNDDMTILWVVTVLT